MPKRSNAFDIASTSFGSTEHLPWTLPQFSHSLGAKRSVSCVLLHDSPKEVGRSAGDTVRNAAEGLGGVERREILGIMRTFSSAKVPKVLIHARTAEATAATSK